jgi:hypothetical protein
MVVFPEDKPIIRNIHASYVDMAKLVAYYQQHMDSGCIHLQAAQAEGILFFNRQDVVNSHYSDDSRNLDGKAAQDWLLQPSASGDMHIHVYEIPAEQQAFWSQMQSAVAIYSNLSTDFTDLVKLLKKMAVEKLTGYIDVNLTQPGEQGRIFLVDGKFIGGSYAWATGRLLPGREDLEVLIHKTSQAEGTFNVFSIAPPAREAVGAAPSTPQPADDQQALAQLLSLFEQMVSECKTAKGDFQTYLKKKFVQNVDRYAFLDPFAAEFDYHDGAITFSGNVDDALLAEGIIVALAGLADDLNLKKMLPPRLKTWQKRFGDNFRQWGLANYFPSAG